MKRVSLIKGDNRRNNIRKSLELISDEIKEKIDNRPVIIKPNLVSTTVSLAATHIDQIRGILDFLSEFYKETVIIAEAAAGNTLEGYRNFDYFELLNEYNAELLDLNRGPFEEITIRDKNNRPVSVRVSSLLLDRQNFIISAAKLKTHDTVVVTLSIKNMAMGAIYVHDKMKVHQGIKQININIAELAELVWPDLVVIDGLEGMEGDGPTFGSPLFVGVAISSTDPLAADRIACEIMGVDFNRVGYLYYCSQKGLGEANLENITVIGTNMKECIKPFKLHSTVDKQYKWM
ncbi:MAG: DUF362 domain-containing protein [Nitrospirae bacterium]|nr:DUF362 domain-containing protein [Nitrospirota bacterium]